MIITTDYVDIPVDGSAMRTFVARPKQEGKFPGILLYSDIFQLTPSTLRCCTRLAGYGFVVAAPEIYHRIEPAGTPFAFDDEGRTRGLADAAATSVAEFDADCRAALDYLKQHPGVEASRLCATGFCIGGHLAFRAALQPDVQGTVCFYGTGIHDGKLGKDENAGTLERASDIHGNLLLIFGTLDPHVPEEGRSKIQRELERAGTRFAVSLYQAEHAFMRDEGPRYDSEATDLAWTEMIRFFRLVI